MMVMSLAETQETQRGERGGDGWLSQRGWGGFFLVSKKKSNFSGGHAIMSDCRNKKIN